MFVLLTRYLPQHVLQRVFHIFDCLPPNKDPYRSSI